MSRIGLVLLSIALLAMPTPAAAQDNARTGELFTPGLVAPGADFGAGGATGGLDPIPYAPGNLGTRAPTAAQEHDLTLEARLVEGGVPLRAGLTWRVFRAAPGSDGQLPLLATARGGTTTVQLAPGDYLVHAAFGRAGATKRVTVADENQVEAVVLDAGGLKLDAVVGDDESVAADKLNFEILQENENGELVTIVPKAAAGRVLRLGSGTYHVISRYGNVNAVVRADIQVEPGKLTEAVMRHTGAVVTLKLVSAEGGEALANTSWTVLTEDGTTVHESIGAFPSLVLAEGSYTAAASHQKEVYSRDFKVEPGMDRDVEVRLTDLVQPEPAGAPPGVAGTSVEP